MNEGLICGLSRVEDSLDDLYSEFYVASMGQLLEIAACEEILAWAQYAVVSPYLVGEERANIEELFNTNAKDELDDHFWKLQNRMNELQYVPKTLFDFSKIQSTARCEYHIPTDVADLITLLKQNIESEECAIRTYQNIIMVARDNSDFVTERIAKEIQDDEAQHLSDLNDFLADLES